MELLSVAPMNEPTTETTGISILTDRAHIADAMGLRIEAVPHAKLVVATNSTFAFKEAVKSGETDVELVSYRSLEAYSHLESQLDFHRTRTAERYVMTWVTTYEINQWVIEHGFNGVITHFDFSCRTPENFMELIMPPRDKKLTALEEAVNSPIRPLSYKDHIDEEIAAMISSGMSDREIADTLYLSLQTIRNRVSRMLHDSGVKNRTHLAMVYLTTMETFVD